MFACVYKACVWYTYGTYVECFCVYYVIYMFTYICTCAIYVYIHVCYMICICMWYAYGVCTVSMCESV